MNRIVPALRATDGPRAADITRLGRGRVVATLSESPPDRMHRRQIEHVEAHRPDRIEPVLHIPQRAVPRRIGRGRAREEFIPRAEARLGTIDPELERRGPLGQEFARGVAAHQRLKRSAEGDFDRFAAVIRTQEPGEVRQRTADLAIVCRSGLLDQLGPDDQIHRHVLRRRHALLQIGSPGGKAIDPRQDGKLVPPDGMDFELGRPAVVDTGRHIGFVPGLALTDAMPDRGADPVVAIHENVRFHPNGFADRTLGREAAAIDPWGDTFNHDPRSGPAWRARMKASCPLGCCAAQPRAVNGAADPCICAAV